jgi:predicted nucleotidyltransferase
VKANAKGEATFGPNSDLDLLVVIPNDHNKREIAKRVYFVLRNFLIPKDIVVVHQSETDAPKGVVASAMDEGRVIYGDRT